MPNTVPSPCFYGSDIRRWEGNRTLRTIISQQSQTSSGQDMIRCCRNQKLGYSGHLADFQDSHIQQDMAANSSYLVNQILSVTSENKEKKKGIERKKYNKGTKINPKSKRVAKDRLNRVSLPATKMRHPCNLPTYSSFFLFTFFSPSSSLVSFLVVVVFN